MICKECGHAATDHETYDGCLHGWTYPPHGGPALTEGCECPWTLAMNRQGDA